MIQKIMFPDGNDPICWKLEHFSALTHKKLVVILVKVRLRKQVFVLVPAPGAGWVAEWDENMSGQSWVSGSVLVSSERDRRQQLPTTPSHNNRWHSHTSLRSCKNLGCEQMLANINILWSRLVNIRQNLDEKVECEYRPPSVLDKPSRN